MEAMEAVYHLEDREEKLYPRVLRSGCRIEGENCVILLCPCLRYGPCVSRRIIKLREGSYVRNGGWPGELQSGPACPELSSCASRCEAHTCETGGIHLRVEKDVKIIHEFLNLMVEDDHDVTS